MRKRRHDPGADEHPLRVLVVDDDEPLRRILVRTFERNGFLVRCARSLGELRAVLDEGADHDVALVDLHLGDGTAFDVARALRSARGADAPPIVLSTGDNLVGLRPQEPGIVAVLYKPLPPSEIIASLRRHARVRAVRRSNRPSAL